MRDSVETLYGVGENGDDMKDGRMVASHDGLFQWHCQVIDDRPGPDMVTTGLELDPEDIIGLIVEPLEQTVVLTNKQEKYFIGPFKNLLEYMDSNMQVLIDDGDKKVIGRVRPYEKHCDTVLKQVKEI